MLDTAMKLIVGSAKFRIIIDENIAPTVRNDLNVQMSLIKVLFFLFFFNFC